jgi:colicin import membrane protein
METVVAENELAVIVDGLEKETQQTLLENFTPLFNQAKEWEAKAKKLVVTDATQLTEMKQAREARLALKDIRVSADKVRKNLKEDALRYGKAVQGVYNVIEYLIAPIEQHLQEQEDFAKIAEAKRKEALKNSRIELLSPYQIQTDFYDLANMPEDAFQQLLKNTIRSHEEEIAAKRKEEEERIAKEEAELKERERIRQENERLRKEAEERENEIRAKIQLRNERIAILSKYNYAHTSDVAEMPESDFEKLVAEEKSAFEDAEKKRIEAEQAEAEARERREAELKAERQERERIERELAEKKEQEQKRLAIEREAEEKRIRLIEEQKEAELSKGDAAKIQDLINELEGIKTKYSFKSAKNKKTFSEVSTLIDKVVNHIVGKK